MTLVKDVFVAGGMPSVTYVPRTNLRLEEQLKGEINEGYKLICVTGPTKSGKTVLARHVIGRDQSALVNGGQIENSSELWGQILQDVDLPDAETINSEGEISTGISWLISTQLSLSRGTSQTFSNTNKKTILSYLREKNLALIVDDFHYLPTGIQKELIRSLKSEIFEGLTAILIAVPHRAFDAIGAEREMEGRFAHIEIPTWEPDELRQISGKGFPELKMNVSDDCCSSFSNEAYGSPLLMQRFCNRLCTWYDIDQTLLTQKNFNPSDKAKSDIYEAVARQFGFPAFEKLSKGPQSRSKRIDRSLADGSGQMDIYQCVLKAVANTGPKKKIHYNEIRDELRKILVDTDIPQKHEVSSALGHMSSIAKDEIQGEPVLEWNDDYLHLTDPFLMFFMRWSQRVHV